MNKRQLAELLARQSHRSRAQAADSVDKLVYGILKGLRTSRDSDGATDVERVVPPTAKHLPAPGKQGSGQADEIKKRKS